MSSASFWASSGDCGAAGISPVHSVALETCSSR